MYNQRFFFLLFSLSTNLRLTIKKSFYNHFPSSYVLPNLVLAPIKCDIMISFLLARNIIFFIKILKKIRSNRDRLLTIHKLYNVVGSCVFFFNILLFVAVLQFFLSHFIYFSINANCKCFNADSFMKPLMIIIWK